MVQYCGILTHLRRGFTTSYLLATNPCALAPCRGDQGVGDLKGGTREFSESKPPRKLSFI